MGGLAAVDRGVRGLAKIPIGTVLKGSAASMLVTFAILISCIYLPGLSLFLLRMMS